MNLTQNLIYSTFTQDSEAFGLKKKIEELMTLGHNKA